GWHVFSDARLKSNLAPLSGSLQKLMLLKPYQYNYKLAAASPLKDSASVNVKKAFTETLTDSSLHYGLVAQDLQAVFPNLVRQDEKGLLSINYTELIPVLIKAIQEQNERIKNLENLLLAKTGTNQ
ncbi:MAG TPA: tail fiber domain-containing protein, partial [Flavisolibacter sp.]|nr:tail fiber domain-containing protein [Flavisolibacter sp.]